MNRRQLLLGSAATVAASTIPLPAKLGMSEAASAVVDIETLPGPTVMISTPSAPYYMAEYVELCMRDIARAYHVPWEQLTAEWPT
ncbi:hypothetical protein [Neoaquamicrobium sediminum]|uniref:hypothetical protein n=1 Tax=Neoaquamicrobium sediminum TaxID=1849104 RepID=UPI001564A284|nr:hypothetical protein [Mesorhizobium sediminum]NRC54170.1 hypothetical protein [Mesorhizobium sediminum]